MLAASCSCEQAARVLGRSSGELGFTDKNPHALASARFAACSCRSIASSVALLRDEDRGENDAEAEAAVRSGIGRAPDRGSASVRIEVPPSAADHP